MLLHIPRTYKVWGQCHQDVCSSCEASAQTDLWSPLRILGDNFCFDYRHIYNNPLDSTILKDGQNCKELKYKYKSGANYHIPLHLNGFSSPTWAVFSWSFFIVFDSNVWPQYLQRIPRITLWTSVVCLDLRVPTKMEKIQNAYDKLNTMFILQKV